MYSYGYNNPNASISRLDELLNRNQLIYQNLKEKLDGINKSNQNIYKNINHIQTNLSDPFSQQSSAIEKEPTMRTQSIKIDNEESIPRFSNHHQLEKIQEHQEVTFSEDHNLESFPEEQRLRKLIEQQTRLRELEIMLEKQMILEEERRIQLDIIRRNREESERASSRREEVAQKLKEDVGNSKYLGQSSQSQDSQAKRYRPQSSRDSKTTQNGIKNNSIYLNQVPKTSLVDAEDEIPTFRQSSFSKRNDISSKTNELETSKNEKYNRGIESDRSQDPNSKRFRNQIRDISASKRINESSEINISKNLNNSKDVSPSKKYQDKIKKQQIQNQILLLQQYERQQKQNQTVNIEEVTALNPKEGQYDRYKNSDHQNRFLNIENENNFENTYGYSYKKSTQHMTPYRELNSHFRTKLQQIQLVPQCYIFAPFNKVYRSPILQVKPGCLFLERKSKTTNLASSSRNKIVDGIKYKFKNVLTDEQLLLKNLFCSDATLDFSKKQANKVAIVGGKETLKKKIHMGILAYCNQQLLLEIDAAYKTMVIKIQHQSIVPGEDPFTIDSVIDLDPLAKRISLMKLQKIVNDICDTIKRWGMSKGSKKILRMTKLTLIVNGLTEWSFNIISSNRYDYEFLRHLKVNKICWCINPLIKNYDQVRDTLESMRHYVQSRKTL